MQNIDNNGFYITNVAPALGSSLFVDKSAENIFDEYFYFGDIDDAVTTQKDASTSASAPNLNHDFDYILQNEYLKSLDNKTITFVTDTHETDNIKPFNPQLQNFNGEEEHSRTFENILNKQKSEMDKFNKNNSADLPTNENKGWDIGTQIYITSITIIGLFIFYRLYEK